MLSNMQPCEKRHTSFEDIVRILYGRKWLIIGLPLILSAMFAFVLIDMPNRYKSNATLVSAAASNSKVSGQLGSLAALAGVNLGGLAGNDKTDYAIEVIVSREFIESFIKKRDLLIPLMATESVDLQTGQLILNPEIYDEKNKKWVREVSFPYTPEPSTQEAHKAFLASFSISKDKVKNTVYISFEHYSPDFSKNVTNWIVEDINDHIRQSDIRDAQNSIQFLNKEADVATIAEIRNVVYALLEEQLKTLMVANVRHEYVFKFIDRAVSPQEKSGPKRALILIMFYLFLLFLTSIYVMISYRIKSLSLGKQL